MLAWTSPILGQDRILWKHKDGSFQKTGTNWIEKDRKGAHVGTFAETKRTDESVDLFDAKRKCTVQLFSDHCDIKFATKAKSALQQHKGGWVTPYRGEGIQVAQASGRLIKQIEQGTKDGFNFPDNLFSTGGGWIQVDQANFVGLFQVVLKEGTQYRFLAGGDNNAKHVELQITDKDQKKVFAKDEGNDPHSRIDYTAKADGIYIVRIRLADSVEQRHCFVLTIIMQK